MKIIDITPVIPDVLFVGLLLLYLLLFVVVVVVWQPLPRVFPNQISIDCAAPNQIEQEKKNLCPLIYLLVLSATLFHFAWDICSLLFLKWR